MPWCPKCKTEYKEGIKVCVDCGAELVEEQQKTYDYSPLYTLEKKEVADKLMKYFEYSKIDSHYEYEEEESGYVVYVRDEEMKKAKKSFQAFYTVEMESIIHDEIEEKIKQAAEMDSKTDIIEEESKKEDSSLEAKDTTKQETATSSDHTDMEKDTDSKKDSKAEKVSNDAKDAEDSEDVHALEVKKESKDSEESETKKDSEESETKKVSKDSQDSKVNDDDSGDSDSDEHKYDDIQGISEEESDMLQDKRNVSKMMYDGGIYEKKRDKATDLRSTAFTFLGFGVLGLVIVGLNLTGVIDFIGSTLQYILFTVVFVGFLAIGFNSLSRAKKTTKESETEEENTKNIMVYLESKITEETLNEMKDSSLTEEVNFMKIMEQMKQMVQKEFKIYDEAYLDYITEEFYNTRFGDDSELGE